MQIRITIANRQPLDVTTRRRMNNSRAISAGTNPGANVRADRNASDASQGSVGTGWRTGSARRERSTDAEQHDVQGDECGAKCREPKVGIRGNEKHCAKNPRDGLEPPREPIVGMPAGPGEDQRSREKEGEMKGRNTGVQFPGAGVSKSSTASRSAAIMLSGRAIPWPAIAKAVP